MASPGASPVSSWRGGPGSSAAAVSPLIDSPACFPRCFFSFPPQLPPPPRAPPHTCHHTRTLVVAVVVVAPRFSFSYRGSAALALGPNSALLYAARAIQQQQQRPAQHTDTHEANRAVTRARSALFRIPRSARTLSRAPLRECTCANVPVYVHPERQLAGKIRQWYSCPAFLSRALSACRRLSPPCTTFLSGFSTRCSSPFSLDVHVVRVCVHCTTLCPSIRTRAETKGKTHGL